MSILVVGGDRLGGLPERLRQMGYRNIEHVSGRRARDGRLCVRQPKS